MRMNPGGGSLRLLEAWSIECPVLLLPCDETEEGNFLCLSHLADECRGEETECPGGHSEKM